MCRFDNHATAILNNLTCLTVYKVAGLHRFIYPSSI